MNAEYFSCIWLPNTLKINVQNSHSSSSATDSNTPSSDNSNFIKPNPTNQLVRALIEQVNQTPKRTPDTPASSLAKDISNVGITTPASKLSKVVEKISIETPKKSTTIDLSSSDSSKENNQAGDNNPSSKKVPFHPFLKF